MKRKSTRMNWFQWLTLVTVACLVVWAVVKFLTRTSPKVCPACESKRPRVAVNWGAAKLGADTVEREEDSDSDLSDVAPSVVEKENEPAGPGERPAGVRADEDAATA